VVLAFVLMASSSLPPSSSGLSCYCCYVQMYCSAWISPWCFQEREWLYSVCSVKPSQDGSMSSQQQRNDKSGKKRTVSTPKQFQIFPLPQGKAAHTRALRNKEEVRVALSPVILGCVCMCITGGHWAAFRV
jgi:hypothetical protein